MLEHIILRALTTESGYETCRPHIKLDSFTGNLRKLVMVIDKLHEKGAKEVSIKDLQVMVCAEYPSMKDDQKELIYGLLTNIYNVNENNIANKEVIRSYINEQIACKLFMHGSEWMNDLTKFDIDKIKQLCEDYNYGEDDVEDTTLREFTLEELLEVENDDSGYTFSPWKSVNAIVGRLKLGGGTLGLIFAPTDTGKSAFCHTVATHLASQCKVLFINNEERDTKVNLRARCCWCKMSKADAIRNPKEFKRRWAIIADNYVYRDDPELSIATLIKYIKKDKPNVVLIDQATKIKIKDTGRHDLTLKSIFMELREVCKLHKVSIIGVTQADAKAEFVDWLQKYHVADCKVGIQGELDIQIGLKRPKDGPFVNVSVCKGKELGNSSGRATLELNKLTSRMEEIKQ